MLLLRQTNLTFFFFFLNHSTKPYKKRTISLLPTETRFHLSITKATKNRCTASVLVLGGSLNLNFFKDPIACVTFLEYGLSWLTKWRHSSRVRVTERGKLYLICPLAMSLCKRGMNIKVVLSAQTASWPWAASEGVRGGAHLTPASPALPRPWNCLLTASWG